MSEQRPELSWAAGSWAWELGQRVVGVRVAISGSGNILVR